MLSGITGRNVARPPHIAPGSRVLLVEDDLPDLHYYLGILEAAGCDVVACASYGEAVCYLKADNFEFVVVNQGSYAFEGRCVLERAIELDRHTPVLVLAPCLDMKCYLDAMQLGAADYLEKPVAPENLMWVLETYLPRGEGCQSRGND
jgi:DNA-binding NtrC family response regulator